MFDIAGAEPGDPAVWAEYGLNLSGNPGNPVLNPYDVCGVGATTAIGCWRIAGVWFPAAPERAVHGLEDGSMLRQGHEALLIW